MHGSLEELFSSLEPLRSQLEGKLNSAVFCWLQESHESIQIQGEGNQIPSLDGGVVWF